MSSQEQRSNLSTPLVGDVPSPKFMSATEENQINDNADGGSTTTNAAAALVGTLKGSCRKAHNYSVAYGPDRFQLPPDINPSSAAMANAASSACTHHHSHHHHHHHQQHHQQQHHHGHASNANCPNHPSFTPQQYQHYYQQIGGGGQDDDDASEQRTLQKNQRNKLLPLTNGGHDYQQLALQTAYSRRAISSDDSQPNSVEQHQPHGGQNANDTTSDSDYLSSNLNIGGPGGRGCCHHTCRCGNTTMSRRDARDGPGGSQEGAFRGRRK